MGWAGWTVLALWVAGAATILTADWSHGGERNYDAAFQTLVGYGLVGIGTVVFLGAALAAVF